MLEHIIHLTSGFPRHHSDFLHGVIKTFPVIPIDAIGVICVSILSIEVRFVAGVVPPSAKPAVRTVVVVINIIVAIKCTEEHSIMERHTISCN